jgi:hypothetical protein
MVPSITQRYALIAADDKGHISSADKRLLGGLVGCAISELSDAGVVDGDAKHLWVKTSLPSELSYLSPIYEVVLSRGKVPTASPLAWLVSGPSAQEHIDDFLAALFAPLDKDGYVEQRDGGLLDRRIRYVPTLRGVNFVTFEMVPQIKGDSVLTPDNAKLAILVRKGHGLRNRYDRKSRKEMRQQMDALPLEQLTQEAQAAVFAIRTSELINAVTNPSVSSL